MSTPRRGGTGRGERRVRSWIVPTVAVIAVVVLVAVIVVVVVSGQSFF